VIWADLLREARPDFVWESKVGRKREIVLVGTDKPQMREAGKRDWTSAKTREFLSVLVETCNVTEACRRSGVSVSGAYGRRKADAAFGQGGSRRWARPTSGLSWCCWNAPSSAPRR